MSRLLLDTNIILDAIMPGRPQHHEALQVIGLCNGSGDLGFVSPMSLKDAYYVFEHEYTEQQARKAIEYLLDLLIICPIGAEECDLAISSNEPDFEDGLERAVAELEGIDFIITRDKKAYTKSKIKSLSAQDYLAIIPS